MTDADLGRISTDGDTSAVRLERTLDALPDEIWQALTQPDRLRNWLAPTEIDAREGGQLTIDFSSQPDGTVVRGTLRVYDPPRTLEYDWTEGGEGPSVVRFELEPAEGGTRLTLTHRLLSDEEVPGFAAGWHAHLEALIDHLRGVGPSRERYERLHARYLELRPTYAKMQPSRNP